MFGKFVATSVHYFARATFRSLTRLTAAAVTV